MPYSPIFQEKVTEAASIILFHAHGKMSYLKLIKLLYLADRKALEQWEVPITYDTYASLPHGPVGSGTCDLARGLVEDAQYWEQYIETVGMDVRIKGEYPKIRKLSRDEIALIEEIYFKYRHYTKYQLAELTEKLPEWRNPGESSYPLPLEDILQKGFQLNIGEVKRIRSEVMQNSELDVLLSV